MISARSSEEHEYVTETMWSRAAYAALSRYSEMLAGESIPICAEELLTDLMHFCRENKLHFDRILKNARDAFREDVRELESDPDAWKPSRERV